MPLIGPSVFILGLALASAVTNETVITPEPSAISERLNDQIKTNVNQVTPRPFGSNQSTNKMTTTTNSPQTTSNMNTTKASSPIIPSQTTQKDIVRSTMYKNTSGSPPSTTATTVGPTKGQTSNNQTDNSTGIIILILICLVAVGFLAFCYLARKRGRRYSVDFSSRPDDANIPLSTVQPELSADTVSQNGMKTFESTGTPEREPQESEAKPEAQEELKTVADKSVVDPGAESAAPAPSPDSSEDKSKGDVVEQSPPAPEQPNMEEKTDDEGTVSNKTSVESLKEANENNSNNADFSQRTDSSSAFWDIPLNCAV